MKWFKHDTDGHRSEGLAAVRAKFGFEGIGWWFTMLEMVADKMDDTDRCHLELPLKDWCSALSTKPQKFRTYLDVLAQNCRTSSSETEKFGVCYVSVSIPNLLKKRDEHTSKLRRNSGQTPEQEGEGDGEGDKDKETDLPPRASEGRRKPSVFEQVVQEKMLEADKPKDQNGKWKPPPEIELLAKDLLSVAGIGNPQDRIDITFDVFHACKAGNEQTVHRVIAELKQNEYEGARNLTAIIRAKLKAG